MLNCLGVADLVLTGISSSTWSTHRVPVVHKQDVPCFRLKRVSNDPLMYGGLARASNASVNEDFSTNMELDSPSQTNVTYLVMQVRVRTDAPAPQLREHTDQTLQLAHSFLKCSCRRRRPGRAGAAALEGPPTETQED